MSKLNVKHKPAPRQDRPPIPNRTALIGARATPARKALYVELAAREGLRLSEWLRQLAERRVRELTRATDNAT